MTVRMAEALNTTTTVRTPPDPPEQPKTTGDRVRVRYNGPSDRAVLSGGAVIVAGGEPALVSSDELEHLLTLPADNFEEIK